jgi:hypothetical protein
MLFNNILYKVYKKFDDKDFESLIQNKENNLYLNIIFLTKNYSNIIEKYFQNINRNIFSENNKISDNNIFLDNYIFIITKDLVIDGILKEDGIIHYKLPKETKSIIYKTSDPDIKIRLLNDQITQSNFLILTNSINPDLMFKFTYDFSNLSKVKNYFIINVNKDNNYLIYKGEIYNIFFIILCLEKKFDLELYNNFWDIYNEIITITDIENGKIKSINMEDSKNFFLNLFGRKNIYELEDIFKNKLFKLNLYRKVDLFSRFYIKIENNDYSICSKIYPSKFQFFNLCNFSKPKFLNSIIKLSKNLNRFHISFIDETLKDYFNIKRKKFNFIISETIFFQNITKIALPSNGYIGKIII